MFNNPEIFENFLKSYLKQIKAKKILNLWGRTSDPFSDSIPPNKCSKILSMNERESEILEKKYSKKVMRGDPIRLIDNIEESFDVLVGNVPSGMKPKEITISEIKVKDSLGELIIAKSLKNLSEKGKGIFVVRPSIFSIKGPNSLADQINKLGAYIEAAISIPSGSFTQTKMPALILIVSKTKKEDLFVAEMPKDVKKIPELVENLYNHMRGESESLGELVNPTDFTNFDSHVARKEVKYLLKEYKDLKLHSMNKLALEVNMTRDKFSEKPNSIYLPIMGNSIAVDSIQSLKIKPQNYFQIVLNQKIVGATYLAQFFNTPLGRKFLDSIESGSVVRSISKKDLMTLELPIPDAKTQNAIINVKLKLIHLQNELNVYEENLATAPKDVHELDKKLKAIIESIEIANQKDRVLQLITKGESKKLEYKSTLRINLHTKQPDKKMEQAVLKTITAFMNTEGGTLLVGVKDNGEILGIEEDKFPNEDKFLLHFKNLLKDQIGLEFTPLIESEICKSNEKNVLIVDCKSSNKAVYLKTKDGKEKFYIRTNPASDELTGSKLVEYCKRRFV